MILVLSLEGRGNIQVKHIEGQNMEKSSEQFK
jgi:hypothetical protein